MVRNKQAIKILKDRQVKRGLTQDSSKLSYNSLVFAKLCAILILSVILFSIFPKDVINSNQPQKEAQGASSSLIPFKNLFTKSTPNPTFGDVSTLITHNQITRSTIEPDGTVVRRSSAQSDDKRVQILHDYLAKYNSPLKDFAADFVEAADTYGVDWKLVPAISGVESTFGQHIPSSSFNGWGWGVYGTHVTRFASWRDAIFTITKGLKENYIDKGLTTPYQMNRVYAASPTWGTHVSFFLQDISHFAQKYT